MGLFSPATVWCFAFAGYLLFAGTVSRHELITSAALASGAVAWAYAILRCSSRRYAMTPAHAVAWLKAIRGLVPAIARTLIVLLKAAVLGGSPGRALELAFLRGPEDEPEDRARRAAAVLIASLAPDTYVVRAPHQRDCVLVHTVLRSNTP
ncbi:MAG TPA: hypothetical protein VFX38_07120, partial [Gammaproteobacteria bacterium]|nr:hypothetical protein [Gammaproteobacteria bacterium]